MRDRKYSKYSKLVKQIIRQFFNFHQQAAFYSNSGNTNKSMHLENSYILNFQITHFNFNFLDCQT